MTPDEAAVDEAIRAVVAAQNSGALVTGWALVVSAISPHTTSTAEQTYALVSAPDQPPHVTFGLFSLARSRYFSLLEPDDE